MNMTIAHRGGGLSLPTDRVHVEIFRLNAPFRAPSPACLLFTAEVKAIPLNRRCN